MNFWIKSGFLPQRVLVAFSRNFFSNRFLSQNNLLSNKLSFCSRFLEEDESSLPSPPPVPSVVVPTSSTKIVPCHNGNLSSTTTDEENEPHHPNSHRRNHSEGSRIGHRRTPSMEGVAQIQNGLKRKDFEEF